MENSVNELTVEHDEQPNRLHLFWKGSCFSRSCPAIIASSEVKAKCHPFDLEESCHTSCKFEGTEKPEARSRPPSTLSCHVEAKKRALRGSIFRSERTLLESISWPAEDESDLFSDNSSIHEQRSSEDLRRCSWPCQLHSMDEKPTQDFLHGKQHLKFLSFDALSYSKDTLVELCVEIFTELELDKNLQISRCVLRSFIHNVQKRMMDNPYHNFYHVVDVTQTIYSLALQSGMMLIMSDKERLSLLLAALCHDLEHPGVNNSFLIRSRSALAEQYAMDAACLEKHHSFRAFELMNCSAHGGLLDNMTPEDRSEVVARVQALILATDMSRHGEYMALLTSLLQARGSDGAAGDGPPDEGRRQVLAEVLIKCADMSNVLKPFPVAKCWAMRITDEFFQQGDLERSLGMEVSGPCDRRAQSRVGAQRGFVAFVAPFYAAVGELLPGLRPAVGELEGTRRMWERYPSDEALMSDVPLGDGCS